MEELSAKSISIAAKAPVEFILQFFIVVFVELVMMVPLLKDSFRIQFPWQLSWIFGTVMLKHGSKETF
jgi:hypothetical protein